jgi:Tol biopolymer transport system component
MMQTARIPLSLIIPVLLFLISPLQAQYVDLLSDIRGKDAGRTVADFLTLPVSAGALSRGIASSPGVMNSTDIPLFTANTAFAKRQQFSITHLEWIMGLRNEYAGACLPFADVGTVGFFSRIFSSDNPGNARDIDENITKSNALDFAVGASFARQLWRDYLSAGITAAYVESHLADVVGRTGTAGFDVLVRPSDWAGFRIRGGNIGPEMKYVATPEPLPMQFGVSGYVNPLTALVTLTDQFDLNVGIGALKTLDDPLLIGGSLESRIINRIYVRVGYEYPYGRDPSIQGLAIGAAAFISHYGLEFGWKNQSPDFGSVWAVSVHFQREEIKEKTPFDYYKAAESKFIRRQYERSIYYAQKALEADPNMWQARTLIARAQAEMRKDKGLEMALIYTGNTQGQFVPQITPDGVMGGLARQAAVIKQLRKQYPVSVTIDAGNMLNANSDSLKVQIVDGYFKNLDYSSMNLGSGEIDFGVSRLLGDSKNLANKIACTNLNDYSGTGLINKSIVKAGDYSFAVFDIIGQSAISDAEKPPRLANPLEELTRLLAQDDVLKCTARILVVHDSWERARAYVTGLPQINMVICGSLAQPFEAAMQVGPTVFFSPGQGGKYVGNCVIRFDAGGKISNLNNRLIPLTDAVTADPAVDALVRRISMKIELDKAGIDVDKLFKGEVEGAFVFESDRSGRAGIYLKVIDQKAEFPLAISSSLNTAPALSFPSNAIAYYETSTESPFPRLKIMEISGANQRQIPATSPIIQKRFTADGQWLYCTMRPHTDSTTGIYRVKSDGATLEKVVDWFGDSEQDMAFSSDNKYMAFSSNKEGRFHIYLTDLLAETPLKITELPANYYAPAFSPDGNFLACLTDRTSSESGGDLWIYDRKAGPEQQATQNAHIKEFAWLSDSKTIVFSSGINVFDLNTIDITTGENRKVLPVLGVKNYSEVAPQSLMYQGKQRIVYTRKYDNGQKQIFMVNPDGSENRAIISEQGNNWLE